MLTFRSYFFRAFVFSILLVVSGAAAADTPQFCKKGYQLSLHGGLFALFKNRRDPEKSCWQPILRNQVLKKEDLWLQRSNRNFQFAYAFPRFVQSDHDRIFSVTVKELRDGEDEKTDPYVELFRDKMETLCRKIGGKEVKVVWRKFHSLGYPGFRFNRFHKDDGPRGKLADFHVAYMDARKNCRRTDQRGDRRQSFILRDAKGNPVEFPDVPEIRALVGIIKIFTGSSAFAFEKTPKYRKFNVRIRKARNTADGLLMANFYVDSNHEADVRTQDLSSISENGRRLLSPLSFSIRD